MPQGKQLDRPEVSVTFRMSAQAHQAMIEECSFCGCNVSGFIRQAVLSEVVDRRALRKRSADVRVLKGQLAAFEDKHAED